MNGGTVQQDAALIGLDQPAHQPRRRVPIREVAHDRPRDDPARAEHRDAEAGAAHSVSSRPRSASQNSIRSRALVRSRPVSSSIRLIL